MNRIRYQTLIYYPMYNLERPQLREYALNQIIRYYLVGLYAAQTCTYSGRDAGGTNLGQLAVWRGPFTPPCQRPQP
jgi:hypothetical protein